MKHVPFTAGFIRNYRLTVAMGVIGSLYLFLVLLYDIDLFEFLIDILHGVQKVAEPYEGDELIPVLLLVSVGLYGD